MKILPIAFALAVPLVAGCGQALNQSSLSYDGAQSLSSAPNVRAHPDNCSYHDQEPLGAAGFLRVKICNGFVGRLYYGAGSAVGLKISAQGFASNPGSVPVPAGETPVLFIQMRVLPQDPGPATFTAPMVLPNSNRSRFTGVPTGNTYHFYAYDNSFMAITSGFPINLGSPTSGGTLIFTASPWSPLPQLGSIPVGNNIWFELTTP